MVDFDDLLAGCATALEERPHVRRRAALAVPPPVRRRVPGRQPAAAPPARRPGSATGDDLCVVGDPNQAIYGWNGADAVVPPRFPAAPGRVVELLDNYRSTPEILAVAAAVLDGDTGTAAHRAPADRGRAHRRHATPPTPTRRSASPERCATTTAPAGRWGRQAVLVRTNGQTHLVEEALRPGPHPVPAAWRDAVPRPGRASSRRSATLAADHRRAGRRPRRAGGRDAAGATTSPTDERETAAHIDALVRLGQEFLTLEPAGSVADLRRWLDGDGAGPTTCPRAPTPSRSSPSTPPRASSGRWSTSPAWRTATSPSSHARSAEARAEERRLLYVAVTRAEEVLRCTWAGTPPVRSDHDGPTAVAVPGRAGRRDRGAPGGGGRRRPRPGPRARPAPTSTVPSREDGHTELLDALREWRDRLARQARVPATVVLADETLVEVAERRPTSVDDLGGVTGVGPVKAAEYGDYRPGPRGHAPVSPLRRPWTVDGALRAPPAHRGPGRRRRRRAVRPGYYDALGRAPKLGVPEVLEREADGDEVVMRIRYRFSGDLSSAAKAVLDPEKLTWVEESHHDLAAAHRAVRAPPRPLRGPLLVPRALPAGRGSPPTTAPRSAPRRAT